MSQTTNAEEFWKRIQSAMLGARIALMEFDMTSIGPTSAGQSSPNSNENKIQYRA